VTLPAPSPDVLAAYPPVVATARWTPLGSAGGFSGARVWRGVTADGRELALKAHPPGADPDRLAYTLHHWMVLTRRAGLDFVPRVEPARDGGTTVRADGRTWDVCEWMPGRADFHANPTDDRLSAAAIAVARVHEAWAGVRTVSPLPCPAVERRRRALAAWEQLVATGWQPHPAAGDPVGPPAAIAWARLPALVPRARAALVPWLADPVPVQPCLCDVWHDHILFTADRVTGLIDYAAAKVDHVAVDLARLLGSLIPGEPHRMIAALRAYESVRPLSHPELVELLDWTGVVIGLTNWLRWLYHDGREYADRAAVGRRVAELVGRLKVP
jgi:Ser/Thr protein kinase RdoA (MazF antagonist)